MVSNFGKNLLPKKSPTEMTIREVIDFGRPLVNATQKTTKSSAMGKYQIMSNSYKKNDPKYQGNLEFFAKKLGLDIDNQLFTPEVQDQIAIAMLKDRVPSIEDFAFGATETNLNKVLDELNATWKGVPDSKGKTSKGQKVGRLSVDDIKSTLNNLNMTEEQPETLSTDQQMSDLMNRMRDRNNRMDEQEINAGDKSIESQSQQQRGVTEQSSELGFVSPAEGATLRDIPPKVKTTRSGLAKRDPMTLREVAVETGTKLEDRDSAEEVEKSPGLDLPENAASDAFMRENFSIDEEELGIDAPKPGEIGFTADSAFDNIDPLDESDNMIYQDDIVDEEGNIGNEPIIDPNPLRSFFEGLFLDEPSPYPEGEVEDTEQYGDEFYNEPDQSREIQDSEPAFENEPMPMGGEADIRDESEDVIMNFNEGGEVKADFDGKNKEEEDATDPPPLAKPKEVADDIPALLSEGEYVLPANVVRYIGLERIIDMHRQVLSEIQQMTDLGMIQNVDKNGEPEDDNGEMKFAEEKKPEKGMTKGTIIVASSKPKGIMCDPLKFGDGGAGEADPKEEDEAFITDWTPEVEGEMQPEPEFDFGDQGPEDDPTRLDYMTDPDFQLIAELGINEATEMFGDDDSGRELFKEELKKITDAEKENNKKQFNYTDQLNKLVENQESRVGGILGNVVKAGFARTFGLLEGFDNFMNQKKAESWENVKEAKIKEIETREGRKYDEAKDGAEVRVAQRAAFASQSGDPLEQMFAAGSTSVENPVGNFSDKEWAEAAKQYSDYFNEGGQGGSNFIEGAKDFIQSLINPTKKKSRKDAATKDSSITSVTDDAIVDQKDWRDMSLIDGPVSPAGQRAFEKNFIDEYYKDRLGGAGEFIPPMAEGGGLMVKKKFNSGGTYIPGVGYRETVAPKLGSESDFFGTNRGYDDIISGIYGDGRGSFPQLENNPDKRKRSILSKQLPMNDWRSRGRSKRDPYLRLDLREYETDPEYQEDIMRDFAKGRSKLGNLGDRQSAKLSKELTNYSIAKRQQYQGFLEGDMANLPEGSTNRDALKTIFWKELSFDTTNTSQDAMDDPQPYGEYTAGFGPGVAFYGKPRRPMEAKNFKKMWLTPFSDEQKQGLDNSKLGQLLDLDGPASIEKINRAQSFLTSEGNDRFINPDTAIPAGYIDNIFNEYLGFKGSPLRSGEKSDSMSGSLMGKTYIEGVGYR